MKISLIDIATIHTGIYTKSGIDGEVFYLQARHFNENYQFDTTVVPDLDLDDKLSKHLLHNGDLLFAAKGFQNFVAIYKNNIGLAVASSMFLVIRLKDHAITSPEYLAWYLNHPTSQAYFQNNAKGTSLPSITKDILGKLEIALPSVAKQKFILQIDALRKTERELKNKIESLRESQIQQYLINALKKPA